MEPGNLNAFENAVKSTRLRLCNEEVSLASQGIFNLIGRKVIRCKPVEIDRFTMAKQESQCGAAGKITIRYGRGLEDLL